MSYDCTSCDRLDSHISSTYSCKSSDGTTNISLDWKTGNFRSWLSDLEEVIAQYSDCADPIVITCNISVDAERNQEEHSITCDVQVGGSPTKNRVSLKSGTRPVMTLLSDLKNLVKRGASSASIELTWTVVNPVYRDKYKLRHSHYWSEHLK